MSAIPPVHPPSLSAQPPSAYNAGTVYDYLQDFIAKGQDITSPGINPVNSPQYVLDMSYDVTMLWDYVANNKDCPKQVYVYVHQIMADFNDDFDGSAGPFPGAVVHLAQMAIQNCFPTPPPSGPPLTPTANEKVFCSAQSLLWIFCYAQSTGQISKAVSSMDSIWEIMQQNYPNPPAPYTPSLSQIGQDFVAVVNPPYPNPSAITPFQRDLEEILDYFPTP